MKFRGRSRTRGRNGANQLAKQRLKLMMESEPMECSPVAIGRMKKEIADIISRYFDLSPDNYEIRVILKQNKKRA